MYKDLLKISAADGFCAFILTSVTGCGIVESVCFYCGTKQVSELQILTELKMN